MLCFIIQHFPLHGKQIKVFVNLFQWLLHPICLSLFLVNGICYLSKLKLPHKGLDPGNNELFCDEFTASPRLGVLPGVVEPGMSAGDGWRKT